MGADFINKYHSYINFSDRPSRKLYWNLYEDDKMVGVFGLGSAFSRPKDISNFMEKHKLEFNEIANNIVFCLSNHFDKNAGTKLLSLLRRDAIAWWYERYQDKLKCFQTFILPPRTGAVYKADNWIEIGKTKGNSQSMNTITKKEYLKLKDKSNVEKRIFNSGEVKYLIRKFNETEPKIIFMKLNKEKLINKIIRDIYIPEQLGLF